MINLKKEFDKKFICRVHPNDSIHHFKEGTPAKLPTKILDFIRQREKKLLDNIEYYAIKDFPDAESLELLFEVITNHREELSND